MKWFEELTLVEKIETYGELMYSLGSLLGGAEEVKSESELMFDIIKEEVMKGCEEK